MMGAIQGTLEYVLNLYQNPVANMLSEGTHVQPKPKSDIGTINAPRMVGGRRNSGSLKESFCFTSRLSA